MNITKSYKVLTFIIVICHCEMHGCFKSTLHKKHDKENLKQQLCQVEIKIRRSIADVHRTCCYIEELRYV